MTMSNHNFHRTDLTPTYAFRLLCEAKKLCQEISGGSVNGIAIHAPQNLADWLDPFAPSGDTDQKIASVVAKIGYSVLQPKVEAVLRAVDKANDLDSDIREFIDVYENLLKKS